MPKFQIFRPKSFPYPTPKYPPRRNGLDWHGLQRCGKLWGNFVYPPRRQKAPHRSNRTTSSATPETMKLMPCGHLWRRCGNSERGGGKLSIEVFAVDFKTDHNTLCLFEISLISLITQSVIFVSGFTVYNLS